MSKFYQHRDKEFITSGNPEDIFGSLPKGTRYLMQQKDNGAWQFVAETGEIYYEGASANWDEAIKEGTWVEVSGFGMTTKEKAALFDTLLNCDYIRILGYSDL